MSQHTKNNLANVLRSLRPHHQVTADEGNPGNYISEGDDPQFYIEHHYQAGWYVFEYTASYQGGTDGAKIYMDYGNGFSEADSAFLPIGSGKLAKRFIHFRKSSKLLRFDPLERKGPFSLEHFAIKRVPAVFASDRMLKKLQFRQKKQADLPLQRFLKVLHYSTIASQAARDKLYTLYNDSFQRRQSASYEDWIIKYEQYPDQDTIAANITALSQRPIFSIVMPTYNTEEVLLRAALDSVLAQSYPHWELCIADDSSPQPHVCRVLQEYADNDHRIRHIRREENGHISAASNSALELASGDFIVLMDHDDTLAQHALYEVATLLEQQADVRIIYSDEDKIDRDGKRSDPHFKSGWNRDLLYSQNYVSHLGVYRRDLIEQVGGFRLGLEGSQDYDLLLRCLLHVNDSQIAHIPKVLYHWRMIEGSTALESGEKSYTTEAGIKALQHHFAQRGIDAGISSHYPNMYRVRWPLPDTPPLVSLIIPTRDGYDILRQCIDSILQKTSYTNYEILIVDNQTTCAKTLAYFEECSNNEKIRVLPYPHPFNYSAINNFAVQQAQGEIIGLINNDIEVISPDWLTEMVSHALRPEIGCVGAKLYFPDDRIQHAGVICGLGGVAGHSHKYFAKEHPGYFYRLQLTQNLSAVTAAALLVRKESFLKVGGLNEEHLKIAFNDVDFCIKVREAGLKNVWTPFAELYHHESISRGAEDNPEKVARFNSEMNYMKTAWAGLLERDPYYSKNLTLDREDFTISG